MQEKRVIHFGFFIRWRRVHFCKMKRPPFAALIRLTPERIWAIEKNPEPKVNETTFAALEEACGFKPGELTEAWQSTPVPIPKDRGGKKPSPATIANALRAFAKLGTLEAQEEILSQLQIGEVQAIRTAVNAQWNALHVEDPAPVTPATVTPPTVAKHAEGKAKGPTPDPKRNTPKKPRKTGTTDD